MLIKKAQPLIFQLGKKITSKNISDLLQDQSWVPTRASEGSTHILFNVAYPLITRTHFLSVSQLRTLFFNFFLLFVVDQLHEFELGVWKTIFIHLMHILYAQGGTAVQELNWRQVSNCICTSLLLHYNFDRYRKVETFGRGTI